MTATAIEQTVLRLPKSDRAHLACLLLESLDESSGADVQQLWLQEAGRRADEIDLGKVNLISSEDLDHQVQSLFR